MIEYFETHSHPDHILVEDKDAYVMNARKIGVSHILIAPITYESNFSSIELFPKDKYPDILMAKGLHPKYAINEPLWDEKKRDEFLRLLSSDPRIVAVKTGIDLSKKKLQPHQITRQFEFLEFFINIAEESKLPLVLHIRDAAEETLEFLGRIKPLTVPTEIHCFNYDRVIMEKYITKANVRYFGIGGKITLDDAIELQEAVKQMNLSTLLLESDSPFVKVKGETQKINTSDKALPVVAAKIAELRGISVEEVVKTATENAYRFFNLKGCES